MASGIKKWLKWEFWPYWFFYIPVYAVYLWYSLRARSMVFFSAANPLMELGGFTDYSKYNVLKNIPSAYIPKTALVQEATLEKVVECMESHQITFPIILKPDKGERGFAVAKLNNQEGVEKYLQKVKGFDLVLQAYIDLPLEFGVLYYRFPNANKGHVSSVVRKSFLSVTGDGTSTLKQLIIHSPRAQYYQELMEAKYKDILDMVPEAGKEMILEDIGNHCKGTTFLDGNALINEQLIDTFDKIAKQIPGFYFGRFDLRTATLEDLYHGKIQIIELNGVNSEPAHIYDPEMAITKAYGHLFKQWGVIFKISRQNRKKGVKYEGLLSAVRKVRKQLGVRKRFSKA